MWCVCIKKKDPLLVTRKQHGRDWRRGAHYEPSKRLYTRRKPHIIEVDLLGLCGSLGSVTLRDGALVGVLEVDKILLSGGSSGGITLGSRSFGSVALGDGTLVGVLEIDEILLPSSSSGGITLGSRGLGGVALGNGPLVGVLEVDEILLSGSSSSSLSALRSSTVDGGGVKGPRVGVSEGSDLLSRLAGWGSKGEAGKGGGDEGGGLHDC